MASSSKNPKEKEPFEVQLVSNEVKQPNFRAIPEVAYKNDPASRLLIIQNEESLVNMKNSQNDDVWQHLPLLGGRKNVSQTHEFSDLIFMGQPNQE